MQVRATCPTVVQRHAEGAFTFVFHCVCGVCGVCVVCAAPSVTGSNLVMYLLESWGDQEFIGLTGFQVLNQAFIPVRLLPTQLRCIVSTAAGESKTLCPVLRLTRPIGWTSCAGCACVCPRAVVVDPMQWGPDSDCSRMISGTNTTIDPNQMWLFPLAAAKAVRILAHCRCPVTDAPATPLCVLYAEHGRATRRGAT